ncbi:MAG: hypothetical protein HY329_22835 [Chloroflexi bacterium]|nr:hypothetical protein [Chloroflexota bacterium]
MGHDRAMIGQFVARSWPDRGGWHGHHRIDDAAFAVLREHFDEAEIVELSWVIAEFIALGKLIYVFQVPYGAPTPAAAGQGG